MSPAFRRFAVAGALMLAGVSTGLAVVHTADAKKAGEWAFYSADNSATKYSAADQINKDNVAGLRVAWRRPQVDPAILAANSGLRISNRFTASPIMVNGVLYAPDGLGLVEAMDPATGRTLWTQPPLMPGTDGLLGGGAHWGVAYWRQGSDARIYTTRAQYLFALDAKTGQPIAGFGDGGKVDLNVGLGPLMKAFRWSGVPSSPATSSSSGRRCSSRTRREPWKGRPATSAPTTCAPASCAGPSTSSRTRRDPGVETWEKESWTYTGAGNVWSLMSADDELGYVYLPTSGRPTTCTAVTGWATTCSPTADRLPRREDRQARLALPDRPPRSVGLRLPAAPMLADITVDGRPNQGGHAGHQAGVRVRVRSRDRQAGVADRRASGAGVERARRADVADAAVPDQAAAVRAAGRLQVDDLIDFTPELRAEALEIVKQYVIGPMFTPPSIRGDGPGGDQRHASAARLGRRRELDTARRSIPRPGCCTCRR